MALKATSYIPVKFWTHRVLQQSVPQLHCVMHKKVSSEVLTWHVLVSFSWWFPLTVNQLLLMPPTFCIFALYYSCLPFFFFNPRSGLWSTQVLGYVTAPRKKPFLTFINSRFPPISILLCRNTMEPYTIKIKLLSFTFLTFS